MNKRSILIFLMVLIGGTSIWPDTSPLPRGPEKRGNSSKKCAICHIRWATSFQNGNTKIDHPTIKSIRQAGSADMCLSCHDGSVVDSRYKVWSTNNHVSGKPPPDRVHIPTDIFPLDNEGHMTCATCHTAHAIRDDVDMKSVIFLRKPNENSSLCLLCHTQYKGGMQIQHPLGKQKIKIPSIILNAGGKTSPDGQSIFCQTCHEPHGNRNSRMLVLPESKLCTTCHIDKAAEATDFTNEAMHRIGYKFPDFIPPKGLIKSGAQFGPKGEIKCLSCHKMHGGSNKKALLIHENNKGSLCLECHIDKRPILGALHDMNRSAPEATNIDGLKASESGVCGACHKSHGWARTRKHGQSAEGPLCIECHLKGGIAWEKHPYEEAHPVNVSFPDNKETSLPLRGVKHKVNCSSCHDIHSNREEAALLRVPVGLLCDKCHAGKEGVFKGLHDPVKSTWSRKLDFKSKGLCTDCHPTHKIKKKIGIWSFLQGDTNTQGTCQGCHQVNGPGKPAETTTHLNKIIDSEWMNRNSLKVKQDSLKIVCVTCHEIHQEKNDGNWLLRVSRKGSQICLKCHPESGPLIGTKHDLRISAPFAVNRLGERAEESGPCCACHVIHDDENGIGPWAFNPASLDKGARFVDGLCLGCHRGGAPGAKRIPKFVGHPEVSLFNRLGPEDKGYLPTYKEKGTLSVTGTITCLSCHESHTGPVTQSSKNDSTKTTREKFLRVFGKQNLCIDCHGVEALWRLLYFHRRDKLPFSRAPDYLKQETNDVNKILGIE